MLWGFVRWSTRLLCRNLWHSARLLFGVIRSKGFDVETGAVVQCGALGTA
jgi:hypothetical protein